MGVPPITFATVVNQRDEPDSDDFPQAPRSSGIEAIVESQQERFWVFILLPSFLALIYLLRGVLFGFSIYGPQEPGMNRFVAYLLMIPLVLISFIGTWVIVYDADDMNEEGIWRPNPWLYIMAGAVLFATFSTGMYLFVLDTTDQIGLFSVGLFIIGIAVASITIGPVYLLIKYVRKGDLRNKPR